MDGCSFYWNQRETAKSWAPDCRRTQDLSPRDITEFVRAVAICKAAESQRPRVSNVLVGVISSHVLPMWSCVSPSGHVPPASAWHVIPHEPNIPVLTREADTPGFQQESKALCHMWHAPPPNSIQSIGPSQPSQEVLRLPQRQKNRKTTSEFGERRRGCSIEYTHT